MPTLQPESVYNLMEVETMTGERAPAGGVSYLISRRSFLAANAAPMMLAIDRSSHPLRVVCVGGHPDDPESGCGGTLALYSGAGHTVTVVYLTRGEAGIAGKSHAEAAAIRTTECETACKILGVKTAFAGQIDGATVVDSKSVREFSAIVN